MAVGGGPLAFSHLIVNCEYGMRLHCIEGDAPGLGLGPGNPDFPSEMIQLKEST